MENARIVCDNACFGFDRAFCLTEFRSCQYEILHVICNEDKFDTGPPDLDTFVQIQQKTKYGFLKKKNVFSQKELVFVWLNLQFVLSYITMRVYIYIYIYLCIIPTDLQKFSQFTNLSAIWGYSYPNPFWPSNVTWRRQPSSSNILVWFKIHGSPWLSCQYSCCLWVFTQYQWHMRFWSIPMLIFRNGLVFWGQPQSICHKDFITAEIWC